MTCKGVSKDVVDAGFSCGGDFSANKTGWAEPSAFLQWKGTAVCMDFHCECGAFCHFDGDFAYVVKCPHCQTLWQMPDTVYPRKAITGSHWQVGNPKILTPDDSELDYDGSPLPRVIEP